MFNILLFAVTKSFKDKFTLASLYKSTFLVRMKFGLQVILNSFCSLWSNIVMSKASVLWIDDIKNFPIFHHGVFLD